MTTLRPSSPPQELLFELHPLGTEPPVAQRAITPGCLLPAPDNKFVDVQRTCSILGVKKDFVWSLLEQHHLRGYQLGKWWKVEYASIVEFCDQLRLSYHIADRRKRRSGDGRWRDADLLPFSLADTVYTQEAMAGLNLSRVGVIRLCEEGRFECYRLLPNPGVTWRISKSSLFQHRDRLAEDLKQRPARS